MNEDSNSIATTTRVPTSYNRVVSPKSSFWWEPVPDEALEGAWRKAIRRALSAYEGHRNSGSSGRLPPAVGLSAHPSADCHPMAQRQAALVGHCGGQRGVVTVYRYMPS